METPRKFIADFDPSGCDNSRFLGVPDWYANGCCRVIALEQTQYSILNELIVYVLSL